MFLKYFSSAFWLPHSGSRPFLWSFALRTEAPTEATKVNIPTSLWSRCNLILWEKKFWPKKSAVWRPWLFVLVSGVRYPEVTCVPVSVSVWDWDWDWVTCVPVSVSNQTNFLERQISVSKTSNIIPVQKSDQAFGETFPVFWGFGGDSLFSLPSNCGLFTAVLRFSFSGFFLEYWNSVLWPLSMHPPSQNELTTSLLVLWYFHCLLLR